VILFIFIFLKCTIFLKDISHLRNNKCIDYLVNFIFLTITELRKIKLNT
jgi:hypothetical protein